MSAAGWPLDSSAPGPTGMGPRGSPQPSPWRLGGATPANPLERRLVAQPLGQSPQLPRPPDLCAERTLSAAARAELQQRDGLRRILQRHPAA